MILNTPNICCGKGTFVTEILSLSYWSKQLIKFEKDYIQKLYYNNGLIIKQSNKILIKNYINKWENNEEQRNMMINYKIDNIDDIINF